MGARAGKVGRELGSIKEGAALAEKARGRPEGRSGGSGLTPGRMDARASGGPVPGLGLALW